jgi:hypothetical protein
MLSKETADQRVAQPRRQASVERIAAGGSPLGTRTTTRRRGPSRPRGRRELGGARTDRRKFIIEPTEEGRHRKYTSSTLAAAKSVLAPDQPCDAGCESRARPRADQGKGRRGRYVAQGPYGYVAVALWADPLDGEGRRSSSPSAAVASLTWTSPRGPARRRRSAWDPRVDALTVALGEPSAWPRCRPSRSAGSGEVLCEGRHVGDGIEDKSAGKQPIVRTPSTTTAPSGSRP